MSNPNQYRAFFVLGFAFIAIGIASHRAFLVIGLALLAIAVVTRRRELGS